MRHRLPGGVKSQGRDQDRLILMQSRVGSVNY